ncbi:MAG TPA: CHAT domain-containing protein [Longimicrobium sp.]|jgi:CHAT domain-containing protein/tetratricopeptide (TPR) repeat protein|uniref:CHAT domain-containing protein n=1 Tax=Longimicrobium sp. TaxID=2029185 RepID=UPI002EDBA67F
MHDSLPIRGWARRLSLARRLAAHAAIFMVLGTSTSACEPWTDGGNHTSGPVHELARAGIARRIQPLLSVPLRYGTCIPRTAPDALISRTDCATGLDPSSDRVTTITSRALAAIRSTGDREAMHAVALIDVLWADDEGISLQRSITYLQTVATLTDRPAPALADLAAAYLVRAEQTQNARDLLEAAEAAERAATLEPRNAAARFNLGLALDRLGLDHQAANTWREFLMLDSTSGWAAEARRRVHALERPPARPEFPAADAGQSAAAAYAAQTPQEARLLGWDRLLGAWGTAVLRDDSAGAEEPLRLAEALAGELETRGGDATLGDAVRAIRAHASSSTATRALAQAHHEFAAGRKAFLDVDYEAADARFAAVLALRPPSAPLLDWALMFRSATLVYDGRLAEAEAILESLSERADTVRHAALAGRGRAAMATTLLRTGRLEDALDAVQGAVRLLERTGETEHLGGALYVEADVHFALGAPSAGYVAILRALMILRPYRRSVWQCNLLSVAARTAATDGFVRASKRFQDERVAVAERNGHPLYRAEARLARAQVLSALGDDAAAAADVQEGEGLAERIKPEFIRTWIIVDLRLARAASLRHNAPAQSAAVLDSVLERRNDTLIPIRMLRALLGRAEARLALGDEAGATADLDGAAGVIERQRAAILRAPLRASLLDAGRAMFDRLIMLRLSAGDTAAALAYLDRSRASFASSAEQDPVDLGEREWGRRREAAVAYALIGDTLLISTATEAGRRLTRITVSRAHLAQVAERARSLLELRADAAARPDLTELYDRLIRPVRDRLATDSTVLALLAEGELAGVPFAALYDSARGRYLVQDRPLRFGGGTRDKSSRPRGRPFRALLVADPAFDRRVHLELGLLPGAGEEVRWIRAFYPDAEVLARDKATHNALRGALGRAGILHFAGHAVFDDERPEQSYLVTAAQRGGPGKLTAAELETVDLRHVRLVVLSACQTLRGHAGRSGGFAGFSSALLAAGAGGTVGSLWRVDDQLTRELMVAFHEEYARSDDAPGALRAAQLKLLSSTDPALRSPAAWAGFRYDGN